MGAIESKWLYSLSRRRALAALAGVVAGSPLFESGLLAQLDPRLLKDHRRLPGLSEMMISFDFEPLMFANVPQSIYDYTAHGDGSEFTLRRNRQAFDWVDIVPGTAIDPSKVDLSVDVLGVKMKFPIFVAPTATQVPLHPDGEAGMHRAATETGTPMILSQNTSMAVDRVASAANGPLWWQFYPVQSLEASKEVLDTALKAGCTAVVVTVDQQASYYERTQRDRNLSGRIVNQGGRGGGAGAGAAGGGGRGNAAQAQPTLSGPAKYRLQAGRLWYTWKYLDDLRRMLQVPMLVKGIVTAEDARICLEHGADGIIVSNHGGRSMDYGPSTLEILPEIVTAVNHRVPVLTDSGYRRGADIFKALALGADAVLLGRTTRWALGAFGTAGVQRLIEMMQRELVETAAAAGCATRKSITASTVKTRFV